MFNQCCHKVRSLHLQIITSDVATYLSQVDDAVMQKVNSCDVKFINSYDVTENDPCSI